jgi:photosystem II stability/assembly factor-like uncharacterized protein
LRPRIGWVVMLAAASAAWAAQPASTAFQEPLDTPAPTTTLAAGTQLSALARAGQRLVAVGIRGLILLSDDAGRSWRQTPVPVSSDLVSVRFVTARQGWAAGHDGVILRTDDGGSNWTKQLDGRMTAELLARHFKQLTAQGDANAARLLKEVERNYENGPEMPILDLWFENERTGWAVGPFGTILGTRDGGKSWESWIEKVDNPKMLHYNAVRGVGQDLYLASEQGTVFKLDRARGRFVALSTGYLGSFFGVVGARDHVIAFGLRGSAYRSRDGGAKWEPLATGVSAGLTGGTVLEDGRLVFVSQDGRLIVSRDQGATFKSLRVVRPGLFTDVVQAGATHVVLTGRAGPQIAAVD